MWALCSWAVTMAQNYNIKSRHGSFIIHSSHSSAFQLGLKSGSVPPRQSGQSSGVKHLLGLTVLALNLPSLYSLTAKYSFPKYSPFPWALCLCCSLIPALLSHCSHNLRVSHSTLLASPLLSLSLSHSHWKPQLYLTPRKTYTYSVYVNEYTLKDR